MIQVFRQIIYTGFLFLAACQLPAEKRAKEAARADTAAQTIHTTDTNHAIEEQPVTVTPPKPEAPGIPSPKGTYQVMLPGGVEQMVSFNSNQTYRLQERFPKDSIIITSGTWTPSDGFIWLYKDQVVRARYRWKGSQLEYYSFALKKGFPMNPMTDIAANKVWEQKKKEGISFFGIGNEPFWSIEIGRNDSVIFKLADWQQPLRFKLTPSKKNGTIQYSSGDSLQVTILPTYCSDGMSDNVYPQTVKVQYKKEQFSGCGMRF